MGYWLVDVVPAVADDAAPRIDFVDELAFSKMASREIIIICIL